MSQDRDDKIRKIAYDLWQREGSPEGRELEHWDEATRQVDREEGDGDKSIGGSKAAAAQAATRQPDPPGVRARGKSS